MNACPPWEGFPPVKEQGASVLPPLTLLYSLPEVFLGEKK